MSNLTYDFCDYKLTTAFSPYDIAKTI